MRRLGQLPQLAKNLTCRHVCPFCAEVMTTDPEFLSVLDVSTCRRCLAGSPCLVHKLLPDARLWIRHQSERHHHGHGCWIGCPAGYSCWNCRNDGYKLDLKVIGKDPNARGVSTRQAGATKIVLRRV